MPGTRKQEFLSDTDKVEIRKKLKDRFIKLYGYDKKMVIDDEIEKF